MNDTKIYWHAKHGPRMAGLALMGLSLLWVSPLSAQDFANKTDGKNSVESSKNPLPSGRQALMGIQVRMKKALNEAYKEKDATELENLEKSLKAISESSDRTTLYYRNYWLGYLKYNESIYLMIVGQRERSQKPLEEAITFLKNTDPKDSEVTALLAMAQGLDLQFVPPQEIFASLAPLNENLAASLKLDDKNIRAYYANALSDYNTPKEYGGGKKIEEYLLKAIASPPHHQASRFAPDWGHDLAYALLIKFYRKTGKPDLAQHYYEKAKLLYPDSYTLARLNKNMQQDKNKRTQD